MREFATETKDGIEIRVKVIPRSSTSEIAGEFDGMLKVRLRAPPVDGAANKELIKLFSNFFGVAKGDVSIIRGENSRLKHILVKSTDIEAVCGLTETIASI